MALMVAFDGGFDGYFTCFLSNFIYYLSNVRGGH